MSSNNQFSPFSTISELSNLLHNKKISSVELTNEYLNRIKKHDPDLNSFITVTEEQALEQAKQADQKLAENDSNQNNKLLGIPVAQKDIFCTKGVKTSCGSKMLDNFIALYDAFVIEKFNQAGSVMLGKTNMDEFAMGSSNETSYYGAVKNPWNLNTVPGGSSGGSAACVAAGLAPCATATDTGGSIRQPAAFCGLTGIKPTYGRISRFGMIAFASSLDQGGIITRTAQDAAIVLETMTGFDANDSTSLNQPVPNYTKALDNNNGLTKNISDIKIGVPKEFFSDNLNNDMAKVTREALKVLEKLGATLVEVSLPNSHLAIPVYYVVAPAECSSNLSRYDGVRYGYRCEEPRDLEDLYKRSRSEGFGDEVKRRIMIGTYALSAGYYDAYYIKAQKLRHIISDDFKKAFKEVDVIAGPTTPNVAFNIGEKSNDPISMYLNDLYTSSVNLAGLPGISIPSGFVNNLPTGLHLIGNYLDEATLLYLSHQFQLNSDWHKQIPSNY